MNPSNLVNPLKDKHLFDKNAPIQIGYSKTARTEQRVVVRVDDDSYRVYYRAVNSNLDVINACTYEELSNQYLATVPFNVDDLVYLYHPTSTYHGKKFRVHDINASSRYFPMTLRCVDVDQAGQATAYTATIFDARWDGTYLEDTSSNQYAWFQHEPVVVSNGSSTDVSVDKRFTLRGPDHPEIPSPNNTNICRTVNGTWFLWPDPLGARVDRDKIDQYIPLEEVIKPYVPTTDVSTDTISDPPTI